MAELLDDHGEERGRRREVEDAVQRLAGPLLKLVEHLAEGGVDAFVVEHPGHVLDLLEQPL